MVQFRKKPVVIEAVQWTGDNTREVMEWVQPGVRPYGMAEGWWLKQKPSGDVQLMVPTLESPHEADMGDWIIKGVKGEFYPCKPDIFAATYDAVGEVITGDGSGAALPPVSQAVRQAG